VAETLQLAHSRLISGAFQRVVHMLKRLFWVLPLVLALTSVTADAQEQQRRRRQTRHAPEFDAKASGAALALLVGGALLLSERRRRPEA
jgi:hypothetical protein